MQGISLEDDDHISTDGGFYGPSPANARLIALAPELAALVLDMGEFITEKFGVDGWLDDGSQALLARLDQLGKEPSDG